MSKSKPLPPLSELRATFAVDGTAPSGLRWKVKRAGVHAGDIAGCPSRARGGVRYLVGYNYGLWLTYRVVWALAHGQDPHPHSVDHIDGDTSNNRVENLRLATHQQNLGNLSSRTGSSKYVGVSVCRRTGRWVASLTHAYKKRHLGTFPAEAEAARAYNAYALLVRGEFARLNDIENPGRTFSASEREAG